MPTATSPTKASAGDRCGTEVHPAHPCSVQKRVKLPSLALVTCSPHPVLPQQLLKDLQLI